MIRDRLRNALLSMGYGMEKSHHEANVRNLIRTLKPQDCGKPLIRIGGRADGGYLIPDDLDGVEYCFSPGVSTVAEFEDRLADLGIKSFLADYSVDSPPMNRPEFIFDKKFLAAHESPRHLTLASWKNKYLEKYDGDLLLQMDIEGFEYEVILSTSDHLLDQFRIIVIEFHQLQRLFDPFFFRLFEVCFQKLLNQFHIVHLHPNNNRDSVRKGEIEVPRLLEVTFYNKRRTTQCKDTDLFPHPLDRDNVPGNKPLYLPKIWYHG